MSTPTKPIVSSTPQPGSRYARAPESAHGKEITASAEPNDDRAPMNRVFVCQVCGNAYMDRAAKEPVAVAVSRYILRNAANQHIHPCTRQVITPETVSVGQELWVTKEAVVPAVDAAGACCPNHTRLMDAPKIRVALDSDKQFRIVGGVVRE